MNETNSERLYNLLPSIYRQRDESEGEPLRALLAVVESEFQLLEADVEGLYENWFIETCAEWVVPYLGDLLGIRGLNAEKNIVVSQRARVANALSAARRKGTTAALEQLVRDTTGWHVKAVEFFDQLTATQHVRHARLGQGGTFDVRQGAAALAGPFNLAAHTPDARRMDSVQGHYNLANLGLFLWRLQSYPVIGSPAHPMTDPADGRYTFNPVGRARPLFNRPRIENDFSHAAEEVNLPVPIRPEAFERDLAVYRERYAAIVPAHQPLNSDYYGPERSLNLIKDGQSVPPIEVMSADLSQWAMDAQLDKTVAVDVRLGRLMFASGHQPNRTVEVNFNYGFSADMGGGPYDRHLTLIEPGPDTLQITVSKSGETTTLQQALQAWMDANRPEVIIQITDNGIYSGDLQIDFTNLDSPRSLVIQAADGVRPSVRLFGALTVTSPVPEATLTLNGLLIEGEIEVQGSLQLNISHCTLMPVQNVLTADTGASGLEVTITHSLVGPLRLPAECKQLTIQDSVVDAPDINGQRRPAIAADNTGGYGPPTSLERTTLFGSVYVKELALASEVIFTAPVQAATCETGCVRYSYVPPGSSTPPRFRCQPDLALAQRAKDLNLNSAEALPPTDRLIELARLRPRFTSSRYGDPAYAQLALNCAPEIRTGAEDGSEMGVFQHLYQPQRETNLRLVLEEYLRFGLEAGILYVT
jgi:phage tail-like protein